MGSNACSASTNAAVPPWRCDSAMTCNVRVVLPKMDIHVIISHNPPPFGNPPPKAKSRLNDPVEIVSTGTILLIAQDALKILYQIDVSI